MAGWFGTFGPDLAALAVYVVAFASFRAVQRRRVRLNPNATLQSQQKATRARWVEEVIASGNGILGVQTLRNAIMGSVYFASNTMFLMIGVVTLSAQERLAEEWQLLDPGNPASATLTHAKLLLLLLTLLIAFFSFVNAIRLFEHASVGIGLKTIGTARVTEQVDAAWRYQGTGVRCYYFAGPVLFWLFGAPWFLLAGAGSILLMHLFDAAPAVANN